MKVIASIQKEININELYIINYAKMINNNTINDKSSSNEIQIFFKTNFNLISEFARNQLIDELSNEYNKCLVKHDFTNVLFKEIV